MNLSKKLAASLVVLSATLGIHAEDEIFNENLTDIKEFWGPAVDGSVPGYGNGVRGSFESQVDGTTIEHISFDQSNEKASVVIVPGKSEYLSRYKELAWEFFENQYDVHILDHRSQGFSGRLVEANDKNHVNHYSDYVTDLKTFIDDVVKPTRPEKIFIFAHSMGGAISTLYMESYPEEITAAWLSAPLHEMETGYPEWLTKLIVGSAVLFGQSEEYALGQGLYTLDDVVFDGAFMTSEARFEADFADLVQVPEVITSGATNGWVNQWLDGTFKLRHYAYKIKTPLVIAQAGIDSLVKPGGQNYVCEQARDCKVIEFPEARHEIYREKDSIRAPYIQKMFQFFERY
ncbi:MAG: alpha/beta fold hydrolase [Pseudomonadota bacterium]